MASILAIALLCGVYLALASPAQHDESRLAVMRVLHEVEAGLVSGDPPAVNEGEPTAKRGIKAATEEVQAFVDSLGPNGQRTCKYQVLEPVVSSPTTFASFLLLHCDANPPTLRDPVDARMLYAWKKQPQGWRVVLEMWGPGKM
jgi:hypothetical protein